MSKVQFTPCPSLNKPTQWTLALEKPYKLCPVVLLLASCLSYPFSPPNRINVILTLVNHLQNFLKAASYKTAILFRWGSSPRGSTYVLVTSEYLEVLAIKSSGFALRVNNRVATSCQQGRYKRPSQGWYSFCLFVLKADWGSSEYRHWAGAGFRVWGWAYMG